MKARKLSLKRSAPLWLLLAAVFILILPGSGLCAQLGGSISETVGAAPRRSRDAELSRMGDPRAEGDPSWLWNVLVAPPPDGWDSSIGKSTRGALSWHEGEISDSSTGVGGHDIRFIYLPSAAAAGSDKFPIDERTIAVLSFASDADNAPLIDRMAGADVPLIISGGETLIIDKNGRAIRNIFALDLYRDYRASALAAFAADLLPAEAHIAVLASRFTLHQEREAKICYGMLDTAGFMPMPFWIDASVRDVFGILEEEINSSGSGVVMAFVGNMGAREIWRGFMRMHSPWMIWNCSPPDQSYLSCRGMIFADQNMFLSELGGFTEIRRRMWDTRIIHITDNAAAGRAETLAEWLKRAILSMPHPIDIMDRKMFLRALENVKGLPFGRQRFDISPVLHRPREREIYIAEIRDRAYTHKRTVKAEAMPYVEYY